MRIASAAIRAVPISPLAGAERPLEIVVIADEAHRSQYDMIDGLAEHMRDALPNASFIGLTGTPIETTDANARAVFGDYVSLYDIRQACGVRGDFADLLGEPHRQAAAERAGTSHVGRGVQQRDGKRRFVEVVRALSQAFALCAASDEATAIRDDIAFFQTVRAALSKSSGGSSRPPEEIDAAVRQLVSKAILASDQIIDVFTAAGLKRPDISILDERFLAEVRGLKHKNVAARSCWHGF